MVNKIVGILFLLIAIGLGVIFFGSVFIHGVNEGMHKLQYLDMRREEWTFGIGMLAFLVAAIVLFLQPRRDAAGAATRADSGDQSAK